MSNDKQSSVEWFSKESWNLKVKLENKEITLGEYGVTYVDLLKQAKAMHKEEQENTWLDSRIHDKGDDYIGKTKSFEQYYNETFNTK